MAQSRGVLIVSASTGTGHRSAGDALQQALRQTSGGEIEHVDLLELAPRWVRTAYGDGYEFLATRAPHLWRELYRRTDAPSRDQARWGPLAQRLLFGEFLRLLTSKPWGICLCTHFLPGQLAAGRAGLPPFAMVITDLTLHRFWAQPRVRRYFTANEALASDLRGRLPEASVDATGIPVALRFANAPSTREARESLGMDARGPVVLVTGGGLGLRVEENTRAALDARVDGLQIVAVCGRNEEAANQLRRLGLSSTRLRVVGYTREIERMIAAADLVVTKPGGLTTSEALAVGRPLLLTRPIPGQEEGNVRVLTSTGAALSTPEPAVLRSTLEHVFHEPALLFSLTVAARSAGRPDAALAVADAVHSEYFLKSVA